MSCNGPCRSIVLLYLSIALLFLVLADDEVPSSRSRRDFAVAGYLPEWRYLHGGTDWDAICEHLTHLIIFSIEVASNGSLAAMDRFPPEAEMARAKNAAAKWGTELLICFGGNSRTNGFPEMVASEQTRRVFLENLVGLAKQKGLHGVDYNWEYPQESADWENLSLLLSETRVAFAASGVPGLRTVTMAYYPDGRQERLLARIRADVDLFHAMAYDARGRHSTIDFAHKVVSQGTAHIPAPKLTLGLPFYARLAAAAPAAAACCELRGHPWR